MTGIHGSRGTAFGQQSLPDDSHFMRPNVREYIYTGTFPSERAGFAEGVKHDVRSKEWLSAGDQEGKGRNSGSLRNIPGP